MWNALFKEVIMANVSEIPNIASQISFLYVEHAYIHVKDSAILIIKGGTKTPVPSYSLACLILGPGTSISHAAITALQGSGCLVCWEGENQKSFYAYGMEENRKSKNFLKQVDYYSNQELHMQVVKKMYQKRFPDVSLTRKSLSQLRGMEGIRVKDQYKETAEKYGIEWSGRSYNSDDWESMDFANQAIIIGNKLLYTICHTVILALGYSATIGFIHTGTMRAFVYDLSDLYKFDYVIKPVFKAISQGAKESDDIRTVIRKEIYTKKLIQQIVNDLGWLFEENNIPLVSEQGLWDTKQNIVPFGKNWGDS